MYKTIVSGILLNSVYAVVFSYMLCCIFVTSQVDNVSRDNRRIIVSGLSPRDSVDLGPYNICLKALCETKNVFVEHYNGFLLASNGIVDSHYHRDKLHPNAFSTRKLLKNLHIGHRVTSMNTGSQLAWAARRTGFLAGHAGFVPRGRGSQNNHFRYGPNNGPSHNGQSRNGLNQNGPIKMD